MADIVPFTRKMAKNTGPNFNSLLQDAAHLSKEELGKEENGIFFAQAGVAQLFQAAMSRMLLDEKRIEYGLFFCSLYVSKVFENFVAKIPESFYATDYLIRGYKEDNPRLLQEGGDMCCFICVFFAGREKWRAMRPNDFQKMGAQLYLAYYNETRKAIGWHMARNFSAIVEVAKQSLKTFSQN